MQTCSECKIEQSFTSFYGRGTGLRRDCKTCTKTRAAKYKAVHLEACRLRDKQRWDSEAPAREVAAAERLARKAAVTTKVCGSCCALKAIGEFYKTPTGVRHNCKACHNSLCKASMRKYPLERKQIAAIQRAAQRARKQLKSDSPELRMQAELFLKARAETARLRHEVAKQKQLAHSSNRRSFFRTAGTLTAEQIGGRFQVFDNRCAYCGGSAEAVDHVIAISRGGLNLPANIRPACKSCNSSKGAKKLSEWRAQKSSW